MDDFDYKKYSLQKLETWVEDAINSSEASPQEIYDCIRKVVEDNYYCYKNSTSRCYELLCLLNGNGKGHIQAYDEYVKNKEKKYVIDPRGNKVEVEDCDQNDSSEKCQNIWNDFWEEHYYPEEHKKDKVKKWILPVEEVRDEDTDEDIYCVTFPDDLLDAANLKEGDKVEWVDQGNGSYLLKKVEKKMTHQEMLDAGYWMTDDGFWILKSDKC